MYQLVVYVPEDALERVKQALFTAGAGQIGEYDQCCWQVKGDGQFRPLPRAQPAVGRIGLVEELEEWRVEMVVSSKRIKPVLQALLAAHPYETPAYHCYPIYDLRTLPEA